MISPHELLEALGVAHRPTPQQEKIIAADPSRPAVVIAGAGSGKTTTMTHRVLWLIANGHVEPHQVLGLTFTRKAAASLEDQVRRGLNALRRSGVAAIPDGDPTVLTYHSYGQRVLQEHSLRLGIEPTQRTIGEAAIWQMAERIVTRYDGDMTGIDMRPNSVVDAVLALGDQMSEHDISSEQLAEFTHRLVDHWESLPGRNVKTVDKAIANQRLRLLLLPLVDRVLAARMAGGELSFGDQMSWAARIAAQVPDVGEWERARYTHVLLDEYQDTSQSQLTLMRSLFGGGHAVMAVGDPLQAIYEWRGASTGTIEGFPEDFAAADGQPAERFLLTTSWRNDERILTVANHFADALRSQGFPVHPLSARDAAGEGTVHLGLYLTQEDEALAIAEWLDPRWRSRSEDQSFAILVRARSQIELIEKALLDRDLPVEVVGVAGLLTTPEVIELRSMLQAIFQPTEGPAVMRLLSGARWRIGPKDLAGLHRYARMLEHREESDGAEVTIIEALDRIESAPSELFSSLGRKRMTQLAQELRQLRRRSGIALPDLVIEIARTISLDVEIAALPRERSHRARHHVDAFIDHAAQFASLGGGPIAFLSWLAAAENHERGLALEGIEPSREAIQILTIHTAKGLEWDTVVVPGVREGAFPAARRGDENWIENPKVVPFPLRGDATRLPTLRTPANLQEFRDAMEQFEADCDRRGLTEEERLAYVALTRPKHELFITSSWWGLSSTVQGPSQIFTSACEVLPDALIHDEPTPDENRREQQTTSVAWPIDPLGSRRALVEQRAHAVEMASGEPTSVLGQQWLREASVLLAERTREDRVVHLPSRLSVSALVQLRSDPDQLAKRLRRPMPFKPDPLARRGTAFHRWLEERFHAQALFDLDEFSDDPDIGDLALLQERWLESEWAGRQPHEVEVPFDQVVEGLLIRGRMDAVYWIDDAWVVVDWKTGPPKNGAELDAAAVQLAMYRLAWSRIMKVPINQVSAAFHHVAANVTVRPSDLLDEAGLIALIRSIPQ